MYPEELGALTVKDIYNWAKEQEIFDLSEFIESLIKKGILRYEDSEIKLWMYSVYHPPKRPAYYGRDEEPVKQICICYPVRHKVQELDGIVVDEAKAKGSLCHRIKDTDLVFSEGIIGALSKRQISEYCSSIIDIERPKVRKER